MSRLSEINNIKEFKEYASTITRKNFMSQFKFHEIELYSINDNEDKLCPNSYGFLEEICQDDCKDCWVSSIEHIYFKDDIEKCSLVSVEEVKQARESITYDYDKEYTLLELFDFPRETKFMSQEGEIKVDSDIIFLLDSDNNIWEQCYLTKKWLDMKFKLIPKEKEVTFMEVLNSKFKSMIRVEHKLIDETEVEGLQDYQRFDSYMICLCDCKNLNDSDIKEIIRDGVWTIREER